MAACIVHVHHGTCTITHDITRTLAQRNNMVRSPLLLQGRTELSIMGVNMGDAATQGIELMATSQITVLLTEIDRVSARPHRHDFPPVAIKVTEEKGVVSVRLPWLLDLP